MLNWRDPENPQAGGAERVTQAYLNRLVELGHEVFWFAHAFDGCKREEMLGGIQMIRAGGRLSSWFLAMKWLRRQERFDLVIDQHHGIPWFAPWWCGTHCVACIHEVLGPIWNAFYPWPFNSIGRLQERWTHCLYRNVPFLTVSSATRDRLWEQGVKEVGIIRCGIDLHPQGELPSKPLSFPLRLVVVSRLAPNKRIEHAIEAVRELLGSGVPVQLTIVGSGQAEESLRTFVSELGVDSAVEFTGRLPEEEKNERLGNAHFLLHTSQREGWGLNVIEASVLGTPAIVYPVDGLMESTVHKVTGIVVEDETPVSLAEGIQAVSQRESEYQTLRVNGWKRAALFHWDQLLPAAGVWLEALARGENMPGKNMQTTSPAVSLEKSSQATFHQDNVKCRYPIQP